ncbi:MAG: twin-arginine translocase subunit TatC [Solirubrobacteraceae bacterium]
MATAIRTISHEDRLTLVDHLDELRTRLIVCAIALAVAFGICFWQNHALIGVINKPMQDQTQKSLKKGRGIQGAASVTQQAVLDLLDTQAALNGQIAAAPGSSPALRAAFAKANARLAGDARRLRQTPVQNKPVTLGIGEPFTNTVTISFYFALLFALPIILFQLYGFLLPAFSPAERRIALPLMLAIPGLFVVGVTFGYFVVLPASVKFFQNFNADSFNVLVQAQPYYRFAVLILIAMGAVFQVPVGILAATRAGIVTPKQLRANRRYAIVVAAVVAALLPGDVVTMALETGPLILLFEVSILLASLIDRRAARAARALASTETSTQPADRGPQGDAPPPAPVPSQSERPPIPPIQPPPDEPTEDDDAL